jgi:hypothetical protein
MSQPSHKLDPATDRRRYLIHLTCTFAADDDARRYVVRIQPWTSRLRTTTQRRERFFSDEYELVEIVNPLLPSGSDVRDVIGHIECNDGFFYLLHLTAEQAKRLGWHT